VNEVGKKVGNLDLIPGEEGKDDFSKKKSHEGKVYCWLGIIGKQEWGAQKGKKTRKGFIM